MCEVEMKSFSKSMVILLSIFLFVQMANAQFPSFKKAKEALQEKTKDVEIEKPSELDAESPEVLKTNPTSIVFSKSPIDAKNAQNLTNDFKSGDYIYALAKLPKPIMELAKVEASSSTYVEVFVYSIKPPLYDYQQESEVQVVSCTFKVKGETLKNKFLELEIIPNPQTATSYGNPDYVFKLFGQKYDGPVEFAEAFSQFESGTNTLKFLVKLHYEEVAAGVIKIKGDSFIDYEKIAKDLNETANNAGAKSAEFPKSMKSDASLEKQFLAALKKSNDWGSDRFNAAEILKIAIVDADWHIRRHEISGAILNHYIRAAIAIKAKDGSCAYYQMTFMEEYIGNKFTNLKYDGSGDKHSIACENLK